MTGYEPLALGLTLPDPDDRHVLAAAIRCGAQHIVTENLKDFPSVVLEEFDIEAISADEFLMRTFELYPDPAIAVLRALRAVLMKPPFGPSEFYNDLTRKGNAPSRVGTKGAPGPDLKRPGPGRRRNAPEAAIQQHLDIAR